PRVAVAPLVARRRFADERRPRRRVVALRVLVHRTVLVVPFLLVRVPALLRGELVRELEHADLDLDAADLAVEQLAELTLALLLLESGQRVRDAPVRVGQLGVLELRRLDGLARGRPRRRRSVVLREGEGGERSGEDEDDRGLHGLPPCRIPQDAAARRV